MAEFGFGYVDDQNEELVSKGGSFAKFGLNQGCKIKEIAYNPNAGKDGSPADAVDMVFTIEGRDMKSRIYDVTGNLFNSKNVQVGPSDEEYQALYGVEISQRLATIIHVIKAAGVTAEQLEKALKPAPKNFKEWAEIVTALLPRDYTSKTVDIFLEYQWNIKGENTRKFVQIPQNMKGGSFICASVKGSFIPQYSWTEKDENDVDITIEGMRYVDSFDNTNIHPIVKNKSFMTSNKAKEVNDEDKKASSQTSAFGSTSPTATSDWE